MNALESRFGGDKYKAVLINGFLRLSSSEKLRRDAKLQPIKDQVEEHVVFEFNNIVLKDKYSLLKRTRAFKRVVNKQIEMMLIKKCLRELKTKRGPIILALAQVDMRQIILKKKLMKEVRNKHTEKYMVKVLEERAEAKERMCKIG